MQYRCPIAGAQEGNRTPTTFRQADFKVVASYIVLFASVCLSWVLQPYMGYAEDGPYRSIRPCSVDYGGKMASISIVESDAVSSADNLVRPRKGHPKGSHMKLSDGWAESIPSDMRAASNVTSSIGG